VLGLDVAQLRVTASEIGGGFGGKTTVFMEPLSRWRCRRKAGGKPVKLVMSRAEVLRATGPTASASMDVKIGMKSDGTITAAKPSFYQGGAFPGSPVARGANAPSPLRPRGRARRLRRADEPPESAAYRAPGAPMGAFAVESVIDEMAREIGLDPIELR
jgi:CO/xanthine dehydrogenase Mo-binding subunit